MMNEKKELKMMEATAMRRINAGGIGFVVAAIEVFLESVKFGWWLAEQIHQGRCGC